VGLISLIAALIVSIPTYMFARSFLIEQRESSALSRALVDAKAVDVALKEGSPPAEALDEVPSVGDSQPMLRIDGEWFTQGVTVGPDELPPDLLSSAQDDDGAMQRFEVSNGDPQLAIAVTVTGGIYVEVFPLIELKDSIENLGLLLALGSGAALIAGALLGSWTGRRILSPLTDMATVATRITQGDLTARVEDSDDPDLGPIATAFNDMASTVETRLERERRFSANVSHELRSPLTGVLGTAELLETRREALPEREATLVAALVSQVRRFSSLVLDLLELSQIGGDRDVVPDVVDVAALARSVLADRDLSGSLVEGEGTARTDPRRLERILANLVDNAIAHGQGVQAARVRRIDGQTDVCVDDLGEGVAEEDRLRIFEPFNRGRKTDRKGSGLGLAIVTEQARLIGATVTVEDAPGGGARFRVALTDQPLWEGPTG
jgi:signal transduction histidine kinase